MAEKRKSPRLNPDIKPKVVDVDVPGGASILFKAGLVSYDVARLIDDKVYQLEEKQFHEGPGLNTKVWRSGNRLHREFDQPAVIGKSGRKLYYRRGQLHRNYKKGPALIVPTLQKQEYYHRGKLHNPEGPAGIYHNRIEYYLNGKLHRIGGPAVEFTSATTTAANEYWEHGKRIQPPDSEPPSKKRKKE